MATKQVYPLPLCFPRLTSLSRPPPNHFSLRSSHNISFFFFPDHRAFSSSSSIRTLSHRASLMPSLLPDNPFAHDVCMAALSSAFAVFLLRFWEEMAKRSVFDQKLNRKLVHISIGLAFMLFWPLFSSGPQAAFLAAVAPAINIIRMLLIGLGIWKNETMVKSMSRNGDYRELLKGPLYYACTITLATVFFWRTSPVAISAICNLCAGDGFADVVGRRFGSQKLPYNLDKSIMGSFAMTCAGFIASVGYMHYFSMSGLVEESWGLTCGFFVVSLATAIVESLPISSDLDDNLTVPLTSVLVGSLVL